MGDATSTPGFTLSPQCADLTGHRFGSLTALAPIRSAKGRGILWSFKCDCGGQYEAYTNDIRRAIDPSCGCRVPANMTPADRFWSKVDRKGDGCWNWLGNINAHGYGRFVCQVDGRRTYAYAHREAYALTHGPIPEGLTVDHQCLNTRCVNPAHLALVPGAVNTSLGGNQQGRRQTHCKRGHPFDAENTYWNSPQANGRKRCRKCMRLTREARERRRTPTRDPE